MGHGLITLRRGVASIATFLLLVLAAAILLATAPSSDAAGPTLTASFRVKDGNKAIVEGKIGKGGPQKPPRKKWEALLEEQVGSKWVRRTESALKHQGRSYKLSWRAPAKRATRKIRVRIQAGGKTVASKSARLRFEPPKERHLRFDLSGAQGLALLDPNSQPRALRATDGTNLDVVNPDGTTEDAATSGTATVSKVLIAPDNRVYILFESPTDLSPEEPHCRLAEVDQGTEVPRCIEDALPYVTWPDEPGANPPIQFDSQGSIYYTGRNDAGKAVLRRIKDGVKTDLLTDNVRLSDFLVMPDSSVIITGNTDSTGASWVRRISPTGSLVGLRTVEAEFLDLYPDGNVYMGLWGGTGNHGVKRYLPDSGIVEPKYWIGDNINDERPEVYNRVGDFCAGSDRDMREGFCGLFGASIEGRFHTADGRVFVIAGYSAQGGTLTQYFPSLAFPDTAVRKVSVAAAAGDRIVLAGLDANDKNVMSIFDPATNTETPLVGPDNEVEIYHLAYSPDTNEVLFDGLRFSDNKYVLGRVDLATLDVTTSMAGAEKWIDFQVFG